MPRLIHPLKGIAVAVAGTSFAAALFLAPTSIIGVTALSAPPPTQIPVPQSLHNQLQAPLSSAEQQQARVLAATAMQSQQARIAAQRVAEIAIEQREPPKDSTNPRELQRRADVFFYDYESNQTTQVVVNLQNNIVEKTHSLRNFQPPPTDNETLAAFQIAMSDPSFAAGLKNEYRGQTGAEFHGPEQLDIDGGSFITSAQPNLTKAAKCGEQRCVQLLLATSNGRLINLFPIVDLSVGKVIHIGR